MIQKGNKFYALVYPNQEGVKERKLTPAQLKQVMEQNRRTLNGTLPMYSQISGIKIVDKEFEKTPKRSIKRFLYANYDVNWHKKPRLFCLTYNCYNQIFI